MIFRINYSYLRQRYIGLFFQYIFYIPYDDSIIIIIIIWMQCNRHNHTNTHVDSFVLVLKYTYVSVNGGTSTAWRRLVIVMLFLPLYPYFTHTHTLTSTDFWNIGTYTLHHRFVISLSVLFIIHLTTPVIVMKLIKKLQKNGVPQRNNVLGPLLILNYW